MNANGDAATGPSTLLLVDDSPANLELVVESLEREGHEVLVALDGHEALERAERVAPDLVLLDVTMPGIDGLETCRRLKANPATAAIPVIFMSALSATAHKVEGFAAGAVDYLTKPLHLDEVRARVEAHLRLRALNRRLEEKNAALERSERALRAERRRLAEAQRIGDMGDWELDLIDGTLVWSDQIFRIFEIDPTRFVASYEAFLEAIHPEDRERVDRAYRDSLRHRAPYEIDHRLRMADGRIKHVRERCETLYAEDGMPLLSRGTVQEITALKKTEQALRLAASVFHNAREGIMVTDPENRIIDVNDAFTRITGYRRDEVLGRHPSLLGSGRQDRAFYQAMWAALSDSGHWSGEIWNRRKDGEVYAEQLTVSVVRDEAGELSHYVAVFSDITKVKEQQRELERLARYDSLTGIPNRFLLEVRMEQAVAQTRRADRLLAVCYLDLDGFKPINDRFGHEAGDRLLAETARRLEACLRRGDTVARIGGDEFVLLLPGLDDPDECDAILARILDAVSRPVSLGDEHARVSVSIGVTFFPDDDSAPDILLRHADRALYQAKQSGKNRFHRFEPEPAEGKGPIGHR